MTRVAPVDEAEAEELAFLGLRRYAKHAEACAGAAFLVSAELADAVPGDRAAVVVEEPYPALRALLDHLHPERRAEPGVHPTAVIGADVELGPDTHIGPYVVIESDVVVGARTFVGAHCVLGAGSRVGAGSTLHPHVVLYPDTVVGSDVTIHSGARIGADGFGYTLVDGEHRKMPQVGRAVIEDGVEIGANTTIDRGSLGDTVVGEGSKIDNLVQVAHNVRVGARSLLAALVGIAGSTRIGRGVWLGGQSGVINQLDVGDGARVTVGSLVTRDLDAGETVSGMPARPHREELRRQARVSRLERLERRLEAIEEELRRATAGGES